MRIKKGYTKHQKHKKVHELTKGYRMTKGNLIKVSKEAILHAGEYSYNGRKKKKNIFKTLWITRISAALKDTGISYSKLQKLQKDNNLLLNRKVMAYFATEDKNVFDKIVNEVKSKENV